MLVMSNPGLAVRELITHPGTRRVATVRMARGLDYALYEIEPNNPDYQAAETTINGELQLDGAILEPPRYGLPPRILTNWTVLQSSSPGPATSEYFFNVLVSAPHTAGLSTYQTQIACTPGSWQAGEGILVTIPLPDGYAETSSAGPPGLKVTVSRDTHTWYQPRAGSLVLETATELYVEPVMAGIAKNAAKNMADGRAVIGN
jgi:hypothetical protein